MMSRHWLPGTIRQPVHSVYVLAASGTWNMGEGGAILPCWSDSRHYARDRGGLVNGSSYLAPGLPRKMNVLFNTEKQKQKSPTLPFQERRVGHDLVLTPACLCCPYFCHSIWRISPFLPWSTLNCPAHCRDWISLQRLNFLGVCIHLTARRHWEMIPSSLSPSARWGPHCLTFFAS